MKWKTKAFIFRLLELMPFADKTHDFIKRKITRTLPRPELDCKAMLIGAYKIFELYSKNSDVNCEQSCLLEIGAGSDLITAICLRLLGIREVVTTDINRLAKLEYINNSASIIAKELNVEMPYFSSFKELEDFGVHYLPYTKIQELPVDSKKYECIYSSDTLEHINAEELKNIHNYAHNLLSEGGIMVHLVDVSDHYARVDSSITRFNFLTFNARDWAKYNHGGHYVNRLRPYQYRKIFENTNFTVLLSEVDVEEEKVEKISSLDSEFVQMRKDELFSLRARFVLRAKT